MGLFTIWEIIMGNAITALGGVMFMVAFVLATVGAWVQHLITTVSEEMWVLLVVGAIIPPVGVLHGWLVWFGVL